MSKDVSQFAEIMREHWKGVWSFLFAIVRQADVADDLAQETFVRAYTHWGDYLGEFLDRRSVNDIWRSVLGEEL